MVRRLGFVNSFRKSSDETPKLSTVPPIAAKKMPAATSQAMMFRK